jgi:hypothetical protein
MAENIMKRYRIATLMTITLYSAIGMGAILDPEPLQAKIWRSTIFSLTAFILMTATLMAFIKAGRERFGWIGFSVFGWAYLLLLGFEVSERWNKPRLLSTYILQEILESSRFVFSHRVELTTFSPVGHAFFALFFGLIGALIAYSLAPIVQPLAKHPSTCDQDDTASKKQRPPLDSTR